MKTIRFSGLCFKGNKQREVKPNWGWGAWCRRGSQRRPLSEGGTRVHHKKVSTQWQSGQRASQQLEKPRRRGRACWGRNTKAQVMRGSLETGSLFSQDKHFGFYSKCYWKAWRVLRRGVKCMVYFSKSSFWWMVSKDGHDHPCHPTCPYANATLPLLQPIFLPLECGQAAPSLIYRMWQKW